MQYIRLEVVNEILSATKANKYNNICLLLATLTDEKLREYYKNFKHEKLYIKTV